MPPRLPTLAQCSRYALRPSPSTPPRSGLRLASTAASPPDAHLEKIVDDISKLTVLQAADLVSLLKKRLNIQEIALPAGQPLQQLQPAAQPEEAPVEAAKPKEKTIFSVKIDSFDPAAKPKIIREVKAQVPNLNLMEAKKFVESLPKVLKENVPREEADKLKTALEALGAKVTLE